MSDRDYALEMAAIIESDLKMPVPSDPRDVFADFDLSSSIKWEPACIAARVIAWIEDEDPDLLAGWLRHRAPAGDAHDALAADIWQSWQDK